MDKYAFEQKVNAYIKLGGRSQAAVARLLDLAPDTFNKMVRGFNRMPSDVIGEFVRLHGLSAEQHAELLDLAGEESLIIRERLETSSARHSLPAPLRTRIPDSNAQKLVGRTTELDWVCQRLEACDVAAIAGVRGIGGIGKTELAIAAARKLEAHFEGRVIWLNCGARDVRAIQDELAFALGVELKGEDLLVRADSLSLAFRHQLPMLVVLDDVRNRHLRDFETLKPPCPPCALLVTSRRDDLPLPRPSIRRLDVLSPLQSCELLGNLLEVDWLAAEPDVSDDIVELLENIPLALTLAARRAERIAEHGESKPLAVLLAELRARRLRVLDQSGGEARPDLSVVVTFQLSYDDLDSADQARLRRLGVFAHNQFSLSAIQAVWEDDEPTARQALQRLENSGLVQEKGEKDWWMHDLLREYALERLAGADAQELQIARLNHATFWQHYLDNAPQLSIDDRLTLESQRPEVEHAADWLLPYWQIKPELAVELALAISQAFQPYTAVQWQAWLTAGLQAAESAGQRNSVRRLQRSLGEYWQGRGEPQKAESLLRFSLTAAQELLQAASTPEETEAGQRGVAVTQSSLADLLSTRGQYGEAERLYRVALETCQIVHDPHSVAALLARLGQLALTRGQRDQTIPLLQEARRGFVALRLDHWIAHVDDLLAEAQRRALTVDDLVAMVGAAREGDSGAGQQVWEICDKLKQAADSTQKVLGQGLQDVLASLPPETALAALPDDLRARIVEVLES